VSLFQKVLGVFYAPLSPVHGSLFRYLLCGKCTTNSPIASRLFFGKWDGCSFDRRRICKDTDEGAGPQEGLLSSLPAGPEVHNRNALFRQVVARTRVLFGFFAICRPRATLVWPRITINPYNDHHITFAGRIRTKLAPARRAAAT